jgi:hypothetical protein
MSMGIDSRCAMSNANRTSGSWSYLADATGGPVTCAACGCRLKADEESESWYHFAGVGGRDARGCAVECVGAAHDHRGRRQQAIAA